MAVELRSIDEVRELLGPAADGKTDEEVLELRNRAYAFAEELVAQYLSGCREARSPGWAARQVCPHPFRRRRRGKRKA
jgi:hypothetical protein